MSTITALTDTELAEQISAVSRALKATFGCDNNSKLDEERHWRRQYHTLMAEQQARAARVLTGIINQAAE